MEFTFSLYQLSLLAVELKAEYTLIFSIPTTSITSTVELEATQ